MTPRKPTSKGVSFRLTETARKLLAKLAEDRGVDKTALIELLLREEAERRGVKRD